MSADRPRFLDDMTRIFTDAAGAARTMGREAEGMVKAQAERLLASMDLVTREEFEAVRAMAVLARNENEKLARQIAELETKITSLSGNKA